MSDHTEWGHAGDALYTLHPRERAAEELRIDNADEISSPYVLGLWKQDRRRAGPARHPPRTADLPAAGDRTRRARNRPARRARPGVAPAVHTAIRAQRRTGGRRPRRSHAPRRARGQRPRRRRLRRRDRQRPVVNTRTGARSPLAPGGGRVPPFSSGISGRAWRRDGHLAVAGIRSPSPSLTVSRGRSVIGRGPERSTHARTGLRGPSDLFGPTGSSPNGAGAPASPDKYLAAHRVDNS